MPLTVAEIARILIVLTVFLVAAHLCGHLFARLRQPPVIGEIVETCCSGAVPWAFSPPR